MDLKLWVENNGPIAWRQRELLKTAGDPMDPVFPPTFMKPDTISDRQDWSPYLIDCIGGKQTALLDSYASQSNRMEPLFLEPDYRGLVPQHKVSVTPQKTVSFLDAPQRVADSVVRFSGWSEDVTAALLALRDGNAEPLARLGPTSLLFGCFDSRHTLIRTQRIVKSEIRAFEVEELRHRGQYVPPVDYRSLGVIGEVPDEASKAKAHKKALSELGLNSSPTHDGQTRGGVIIHGEIARSVFLNIAMIRRLRAGTAEDTGKLHRYLLGLALVVATYPYEYLLREGCLLRRESSTQHLVNRVGEKELAVPIDHATVLVFARKAAEEFGVAEGSVRPFDVKAITAELGKDKADRKKSRRAKRGAASSDDMTTDTEASPEEN